MTNKQRTVWWKLKKGKWFKKYLTSDCRKRKRCASDDGDGEDKDEDDDDWNDEGDATEDEGQ